MNGHSCIVFEVFYTYRTQLSTSGDVLILDWAKYPNFTKKEFDCQETGTNKMKPEFMKKLQELRSLYGKPIIITSGYRSPRHSIEAKKQAAGPHSTGLACDISACAGEDVYELLDLAFTLRFTGIGVSQRSARPRFIHIDMCDRKAVWSY